MQIPLFPLNTVLFPGMPLRLHIFEERYKEMINECIDTQSPFGVVLIQAGQAEGAALARPYTIGTTAHITQVQRLPYGRMNIRAIGRDRFRINQLDLTSRSFLTADVDIVPINGTDTGLLEDGAGKLRPMVERYLTALKDAGQAQVDIDQLPDDPLQLAYLSAVLLQSDATKKQTILESATMRRFLTNLLEIYQVEVALIDILLSPPDAEIENNTPFSLS